MPTYVTTQCAACGKDIEVQLKVYNYRIKCGHKFYCSKECSKARRTGSYEKCQRCGKERWVTPSDRAQNKTGRFYCSRSCAASVNNMLYKRGENHPNFVSGSGSYRARAIRHYGAKCAVCSWDEDPRVIDVHHRDENRRHNKLENLVVLCAICHAKITRGYCLLTKDNVLIDKEISAE